MLNEKLDHREAVSRRDIVASTGECSMQGRLAGFWNHGPGISAGGEQQADTLQVV
jgi:hypothetical protein